MKKPVNPPTEPSDSESSTSGEETEFPSDTEPEAPSAKTLEAEDFSSNVHFPKTYQIKHEEAVSLRKSYVLHLTALFQNSKITLIGGLSDFSCAIYEVESGFRKTNEYQVHDDVVTGLKLTDEHSFYSSSLDGTVKYWDLRDSGKPSITFRDDTDGEGNLKPINSFDVSCDGNFLAAGTVLVEADAYVLFWDSRNPKVLGGYWETHTDDVTDIKFHPTKANTMLSGSTDGLINVFDIKAANEDDALQDSLNVESSIRKLEWVDEYVSCVTDMETLQFWDVNETSPICNFDREAVAQAMYVKSWDNAYMTGIHSNADDVLVLGGSNLGKGEYLKAVSFGGNRLQPAANFQNNKQIVRCSCYGDGVFVTAGESGIISVWEVNDSYAEKAQLKERVKMTKQKIRYVKE